MINIKSKDLLFLVSFLFIVNSGFHLVNYPTYLTMYITFYLAVIYLVFYLIKYKKIRIPVQAIYASVIVIYFMATQFFTSKEPLVVLSATVTFLFYILSVVLLNKIPIDKLLLISDGILFYNAFLFFIDTFYRFTTIGLNLTNFYILKISLLYADTNAVGINATMLTLFSYFLYEKFKNKMYLYFTMVFIIFVFLTISRAAIIATLLSLLLFSLYKICKKSLISIKRITITKFPSLLLINSIILILIVLLLIYLLFKIILHLATDPSFATKISIFKDLNFFLKNADFNEILWGIGFDNGYKYLGRYAHNYLATYIIETGCLGYFFVTTFLISILYKTPKTIYLLFPFFILGISYIGHTILNLFYCLLALMYYIEKFKKCTI